MLTVLEVRLCKPSIYKLRILGGGKFEYYKSMGGTTKKGGNSEGKQKGGGRGVHNLDLNLVGWGGTLEETTSFRAQILEEKIGIKQP